MRHILPLALILTATPAQATSPEQTAQAALAAAPVWDGHNDVAEQLRDRRRNMLAGFAFADTRGTADAAKGVPAMHTDLARLQTGHVGAQFWSVYVDAGLSEPQAVQAVLEQIDVMKRLVAQHPAQLQLATSADEVARAMKAGRVASLLGMEGGHGIGGSLAVLRQMRALGVRYMTLTHFKNNGWADSGTDAPAHGGLTGFGRDVVREMQRIGMLVDLSHTAHTTQLAALAVARAPVIFSHSGAQAVNPSPRNVSDPVLDALRANGGIIMVNTYPSYVSEPLRQRNAARAGEEARQKLLNPGDPKAVAQALAIWDKAHPRPPATLAQLADHIDHIRARIGTDHIGIGADFDGMAMGLDDMPDVSSYPALFTELARRGYSAQELKKISSGNMLRVLRAADVYAAAHAADPPLENPTTF